MIGRQIGEAAIVVLAQTPPTSTLDWVERGGVVGLLLLAVIGFLREWVVPGSRYRRDTDTLRADRDEWKEEALAQMNLTETAVQTAEAAAARRRRGAR